MRRLPVLFLCALAAVAARAEDEVTAAAPPAAAQPNGDEPSEFRMQDVEIRGELERPDVFYIIPRRKADMDLGTLTKRYEAEIMEPILPGDFEAEHAERPARLGVRSVTK